jgi:RNA polymerase sigma factor (sigma-70 family)
MPPTSESDSFANIHACEAAIVRIRAALRVNNGHTAQVGEDFEMIRNAVTSKFVGFTRALGTRTSSAVQEALDGMYDRLFEDIWSLSYVSLETQFGAYLRSMPVRVIQKVQRRNRVPGGTALLTRLDEVVGEEGLPRHELEGDARAENALHAIANREVLAEVWAQFSAEERRVISWRLDELKNGEIATRLGVSEATATRIYQRAAAKIHNAIES